MTGILLNQLLHGSFDCNKRVVLVLDEIHDLTMNALLLLAILKSNLKTMKLKVILMSATLEMPTLTEYLSALSISQITVDGSTFGYETIFLENATNDFILFAVLQINDLVKRSTQNWICAKCLTPMEGLYFICLHCQTIRSSHILVFLPGTKEINKVRNELQKGILF